MEVILSTFAPLISVVGFIVVAVIALTFVGKVMYKKAPPNVAMVITGPRGNKVAIGKGCFVIPIIQRVDYMSLETFNLILLQGMRFLLKMPSILW